MVWDPARITPTPWLGVIEFFRNLEDRNHDFQPVRLLAAHVASQTYAASLRGATSGTSLLAAGGHAFDWKRHAIRVDVGLNGSIRFTLPAKEGARPASPRTFECDGAKIIESFERSLRDAGWIAA
jgi:hypothetical protein